MNGSHVAGGGVGGIVGVILVALGTRIGLNLTDYDSATIGLAAVSVGLGIGHAIGEYGLRGIASVLLNGNRKRPVVVEKLGAGDWPKTNPPLEDPGAPGAS